MQKKKAKVEMKFRENIGCAIQALALLRAVYAKLGERPEQTTTLREVLEGNDRLWLRLLQ